MEKEAERVKKTFKEIISLEGKKIKNLLLYYSKNPDDKDTLAVLKEEFNCWGVYSQNGEFVFGKNAIFTPQQAKEIAEKLKKSSPKNIVFFTKTNYKTCLTGAAPFYKDHKFFGFTFIVISCSKFVNIISTAVGSNVFIVKASERDNNNILHIPLKDYQGRTVACLEIYPAMHILKHFDHLKTVRISLGILLLVYTAILLSILLFYRKRITEGFDILISSLENIAHFDPHIEKLEKLSKRNDELGRIASRIKKIAHELSQNLILDPLTQIYNRSYFLQRLEKEIIRAQRYNRPLSIAILDIDNFKKINDKYGHPAGDEVLKQLCRLIEENIRSTDIFARIGGEEFAILMPETSATTAFVMAERLRKTIEETEFLINDATVSLTVSFGVTSYRKTDSSEGFIKRADRALYQAKELGKNRTQLF